MTRQLQRWLSGWYVLAVADSSYVILQLVAYVARVMWPVILLVTRLRLPEWRSTDPAQPASYRKYTQLSVRALPDNDDTTARFDKAGQVLLQEESGVKLQSYSKKVIGQKERQIDQLRELEEYIQAQFEYRKLVERCEEDLLNLEEKNVDSEYVSAWREFLHHCELFFYKEFVTNRSLATEEIKKNIDYMKNELKKLSLLRKYIDTRLALLNQIACNEIIIKKINRILQVQNFEKNEKQIKDAKSIINVQTENIVEDLEQLGSHLKNMSEIKRTMIRESRVRTRYIYKSSVYNALQVNACISHWSVAASNMA